MTFDELMARDNAAALARLASLPKTYADSIPSWSQQVDVLPRWCSGAASGPECDGYVVALAAYGPLSDHSGLLASAYCWRRFGPPWLGCDDHKDLVSYILTTPNPDVFLTLRLSASSLPLAVGYLVTKALQDTWDAPIKAWEQAWEAWWVATALTDGERHCLDAHEEGTPFSPECQTIIDRYWDARWDQPTVAAGEAVIGCFPRRRESPDVEKALHAALIECLRPVFIRDVAINILGHVADEDLGEREKAPHSVYAGYGVPKKVMDTQLDPSQRVVTSDEGKASLSIDQIVAQLDAIDVLPDTEVAHPKADALVLEALKVLGAEEISTAYARVKARAAWWKYA